MNDFKLTVPGLYDEPVADPVPEGAMTPSWPCKSKS